MGNKYLDTALFDKAAVFATKAHADTERRGKGFPYIIHCFEAAEIVATLTTDQEILAAAVLHDTVEDTDVTIDQIRVEFGDRVARLVDNESEKRSATPETEEEQVKSWRGRKVEAISRIAESSFDSKMVALGDKLSNMRAIARDYRVLGDKLWDRFHAPNGKADHEWHYRRLAEALDDLAHTEAYAEFIEKIESVFGRPDYETVDMNDYEQSGDGFTAVSYNHKDGDRMMKLYAPFIPDTVPLQELTTARNVYDMGINTPRALRLVTDGDRNGVEFERIVGKQSFARAISNHPEDLEKYAVKFAEMCRKLHNTPCNTLKFKSERQFYMEILKSVTEFTDDEKEKIRRFVRSVPEAKTCLHGDMHIGNVITDGEREWWIDLADFRYGNPMFDMGMWNFLCNEISEELAFNLFHITKQSMQEVWRVFVREYFGTSDYERIYSMVAPYTALRMMKFYSIHRTEPFMKDYVRKWLLK